MQETVNDRPDKARDTQRIECHAAPWQTDDEQLKAVLSAEGLAAGLTLYAGQERVYPFHMPGHKRRMSPLPGLQSATALDITEIPGFDDLHHPEGVIAEGMRLAAERSGSFASFWSVNGSTACILAALGASAAGGSRILVSANRHWSVDHGAELFHFRMDVLPVDTLGESHIPASVAPERLESMLAQAKAAGEPYAFFLLVSPSYEGIVSDIEALARSCRHYDCRLLVDAAHGAHFHYHSAFPRPATALGADIVVESLHKTLPSMTQTAIMHLMRPDAAWRERLQHYLDIFISSSPSYVLMASIDACQRYMATEAARVRLNELTEALSRVRARLRGLRCLTLLEAGDTHASAEIFALDISRITILCSGGLLSGFELAARLQAYYGLVMERATEDCVIAICSIADGCAALERLAEALLEIDDDLLSDGQVGER